MGGGRVGERPAVWGAAGARRAGVGRQKPGPLWGLTRGWRPDLVGRGWGGLGHTRRARWSGLQAWPWRPLPLSRSHSVATLRRAAHHHWNMRPGLPPSCGQKPVPVSTADGQATGPREGAGGALAREGTRVHGHRWHLWGAPGVGQGGVGGLCIAPSCPPRPGPAPVPAGLQTLWSTRELRQVGELVGVGPPLASVGHPV